MREKKPKIKVIRNESKSARLGSKNYSRVIGHQDTEFSQEELKL